MRNKGFTLIELLGVIIILALLMILTFPSIINSIKSTSNKKDKLVLDLVYSATEMFIKDNRNIYPAEDGNSYCIALTDLIEHGDLKGPINISDEDVTDKKEVQVTYNGRYKYELKDKDSCVIKMKPNQPDLLNGSLTPVKYSGSNWVVADSTKTDWYNYENQEWANAVILKSGVTKSVGQIVTISSDVVAMFVWIPRYEYKIEGTYGKGGTSTSSPGEIEINFISKYMVMGNEGYRVHPAFTFGDKDLNGIWIGKFETTGAGDNPTILPSVTSLRSQNVSTQFETSQKFNSYITNGDSHMAKNSEWGAVAYLSQSKYGKYGNSNYTGAEKEVMINNCSNYITGIGADSQNASSSSTTCTTNTYETSKGQAASTTGNITGIYDMSGGAWERVMGVLLDQDGNPRSGNSTSNNSGYTGMLNDGTIYNGKEWPNSKYYETYTSSINTACSGGICYGQALSETKNWYLDYAYFFSSSYPWFGRGGVCNNTSGAGVFDFDSSSGGASSNGSFRVVVS